jgi:hypothetical protein
MHARNFAKCIYCPTIFDPKKGEGDHIIPAALGEFRNDIHFRGVCSACNNHIGKSEQVLLHCGPEALFRRVVSPALPGSRRRGRSPVKGAMGAAGPLHTIDLGDHRILVQPSDLDPKQVHRIDQLVVHDSNGDEHFFRLFPHVDADTLKCEILRKIAPPPIPKMWLHADLQRCPEYKKLLRKMWSTGERHDLPITPTGEHLVDGRIRFTVNDHYWRSLAKIGFHFYLCHSRRGMVGDEAAFADIRDFIMNGGDRNKFFRQPRSVFAVPFGESPDGRIETPTRWCHVLGADENTNEIVAYVHLFVGPTCIPQAYHIVLGILDDECVVSSNMAYGSVYMYDEKQDLCGKAGSVETATVTMYPSDQLPSSDFAK